MEEYIFALIKIYSTTLKSSSYENKLSIGGIIRAKFADFLG
jgi:hypothetical protein